MKIMGEEKSKTNGTTGNNTPENNSEKEAQLKTEFLRMQFCVEVLSDLIAFQKRSEQEWEKAEKLIRDRKRKKRRSKWEGINGTGDQKNQ
jgi:hypothetical protein